LRGQKRSFEDIALAVQDIWPGAQPSHVQGLVAGLASYKVRYEAEQRNVRNAISRSAPWRPGTPKPERV
jgi:hypothetical protein